MADSDLGLVLRQYVVNTGATHATHGPYAGNGVVALRIPLQRERILNDALIASHSAEIVIVKIAHPFIVPAEANAAVALVGR